MKLIIMDNSLNKNVKKKKVFFVPVRPKENGEASFLNMPVKVRMSKNLRCQTVLKSNIDNSQKQKSNH